MKTTTTRTDTTFYYAPTKKWLTALDVKGDSISLATSIICAVETTSPDGAVSQDELVGFPSNKVPLAIIARLGRML